MNYRQINYHKRIRWFADNYLKLNLDDFIENYSEKRDLELGLLAIKNGLYGRLNESPPKILKVAIAAKKVFNFENPDLGSTRGKKGRPPGILKIKIKSEKSLVNRRIDFLISISSSWERWPYFGTWTKEAIVKARELFTLMKKEGLYNDRNYTSTDELFELIKKARQIRRHRANAPRKYIRTEKACI